MKSWVDLRKEREEVATHYQASARSDVHNSSRNSQLNHNCSGCSRYVGGGHLHVLHGCLGRPLSSVCSAVSADQGV